MESGLKATIENTQANQTRDERATQTRATENMIDLYETSGPSPGPYTLTALPECSKGKTLNTTVPAATEQPNRASDSATTTEARNEPTIEDQADSSMSREVELYGLLRAEGWPEEAAEREAERITELEAERNDAAEVSA